MNKLSLFKCGKTKTENANYALCCTLFLSCAFELASPRLAWPDSVKSPFKNVFLPNARPNPRHRKDTLQEDHKAAISSWLL